MSKVITLPYDWEPYPWQQEVLDARAEGIDRFCEVAHRRAGKSALTLNFAAIEAHKRVGTYLHVFPFANQGRKAIWRGMDDEGRKFLDQAFPLELRKTSRDAEMSIELLNGSLWQLVGADNPSAAVGSNLQGVILDEFALHEDTQFWDYIRPILARNGGWAMAISTFRGRNHMYDMYELNKNNPDWHCRNLTVVDTCDNEGKPLVTHAAIEAERAAGMPEAVIRQEFYNDPTAAFSGAYYQRQIAAMKHEGRTGDYPYNPNQPLHVAFDIGTSDHTVAVFFQRAEPDKVVIVGSKRWQFLPPAEVAKDILKTFPFGGDIQDVVLPWDAGKPGPAGDTWMSEFEAFNLAKGEYVVLRKGYNSLHAEIAMVQSKLQTTYVDTSVRAFSNGPNNSFLLDGMAGYRTQTVKGRPGTYSKLPMHNVDSHTADAVRYMYVYLADADAGFTAGKPDYTTMDKRFA